MLLGLVQHTSLVLVDRSSAPINRASHGVLLVGEAEIPQTSADVWAQYELVERILAAYDCEVGDARNWAVSSSRFCASFPAFPWPIAQAVRFRNLIRVLRSMANFTAWHPLTTHIRAGCGFLSDEPDLVTVGGIATHYVAGVPTHMISLRPNGTAWAVDPKWSVTLRSSERATPAHLMAVSGLDPASRRSVRQNP